MSSSVVLQKLRGVLRSPMKNVKNLNGGVVDAIEYEIVFDDAAPNALVLEPRHELKSTRHVGKPLASLAKRT